MSQYKNTLVRSMLFFFNFLPQHPTVLFNKAKENRCLLPWFQPEKFLTDCFEFFVPTSDPILRTEPGCHSRWVGVGLGMLYPPLSHLLCHKHSLPLVESALPSHLPRVRNWWISALEECEGTMAGVTVCVRSEPQTKQLRLGVRELRSENYRYPLASSLTSWFQRTGEARVSKRVWY